MNDILEQWLIDQGIQQPWADYVGWAIMAVAVVLLALLTNFIAKRILLKGVSIIVRRSRTTWDDALLKNRVFVRLSHLAPALVFYYSAHLFGDAQTAIQRLSIVYMILTGTLVFNSFLNAVVDIYQSYEISRLKPVKGYIQIVKIVVAIFVGVIVIAMLMDRNPLLLLSGLGAMTAILILVFKDSILGLVASVQLSANDMVRIGDWIEMPKYGADGDVIDVTLHTVKVRNWDKTITTIPAYALISDSFKNWRGMQESGGRRIKRSFSIDMTSIQLCTNEMLDRFEKYHLIKDYVNSRRKEVDAYNAERNIDTSELINGRKMTNVGTLRAYIFAYLKNHPKVHQDLTMLVRHLPPTEHGLPIEIYCFSNDQAWANYEGIQADIFDHILAAVPHFDLRLYQQPSGHDMRTMTARLDTASSSQDK